MISITKRDGSGGFIMHDNDADVVKELLKDPQYFLGTYEELKIDNILKELEKLRLDHYINDEDCWYSCPKSGECCNGSEDQDHCNCGADKHNEILDKIILMLKNVEK